MSTTNAIWEQPLNERIRTCLRLEQLFSCLTHYQQQSTTTDHRSALNTLGQITLVLSRGDFKSDLCKELERCKLVIHKLQSHADVDNRSAASMLEELQESLDSLYQYKKPAGHAIRQSELLATIRQRIVMPGGACSFDTPSLHFWLQKTAADRQADIANWMTDIESLLGAVDTLLSLIRSSTSFTEQTANNGSYHQMLDKIRDCQLIRIAMPLNSHCFPEISGGRHRVSLRFVTNTNCNERIVQSTENIAFGIACCSFS